MYETEEGAPDAAVDVAVQLHEHCVNMRGYDTQDILFTAHDTGEVTGSLKVTDGSPTPE